MSNLFTTVSLIGLGAGITLLSLKHEEIGESVSKWIKSNGKNKQTLSVGVDPIDMTNVALMKDTSTSPPCQPYSMEQPLVPIWDANYHMAMMGQPPVNVLPIYPPTTTPPVDPYYQWNHYTMQYEYQPRSMLTHCNDLDIQQCNTTGDQGSVGRQTENIASNDLAQLIFDAGKFYLSHNSQITGMTSFKDVIAVCEYPHKFYDEIRHSFNQQGAAHLSKLLEQDAEVQAILSMRRDPEGTQVLNNSATAEHLTNPYTNMFRDSEATVYSDQPQHTYLRLQDQQPIPKKNKSKEKKKAVFTSDASFKEDVEQNTDKSDPRMGGSTPAQQPREQRQEQSEEETEKGREELRDDGRDIILTAPQIAVSEPSEITAEIEESRAEPVTPSEDSIPESSTMKDATEPDTSQIDFNSTLERPEHTDDNMPDTDKTEISDVSKADDSDAPGVSVDHMTESWQQICPPLLVVVSARHNDTSNTSVTDNDDSSKSVASLSADSAIHLAVASENSLTVAAGRPRSSSLRKNSMQSKMHRRSSWQSTSTAGGKLGETKRYSGTRKTLRQLRDKTPVDSQRKKSTDVVPSRLSRLKSVKMMPSLNKS